MVIKNDASSLLNYYNEKNGTETLDGPDSTLLKCKNLESPCAVSKPLHNQPSAMCFTIMPVHYFGEYLFKKA